MIIFYKPQYLLFLFLIPLIIFIHLNALRTAKRKAIKFANFEAIRRINGVEIFSKNITILYLNILIILLISLSLSGMSITKEVDTSKISFVIVFDSSRSMMADDISPSRFEASKKAAIDFLTMVPEKTRVGVVSFSGSPIIETEITDDKTLIKNSIKNIEITSIGGTDAYNGLITASNMLANEESKAIILISDGGINVNSIQDIVDYTTKNKMIIHSLGVGTSEGGSDSAGAFYTIYEDTLKLVAESSGGRYYNIRNIEDFYYSLSSLIEVTKKKAIIDLSFYLLVFALIAIILDFYFINNRFRIFP